MISTRTNSPSRPAPTPATPRTAAPHAATPGTPGSHAPTPRTPTPTARLAVWPFVLATFALSWGFWGAAWLAGGDIADPVVFALFAAGGCGPTLAALIFRLAGRRGGRSLRWGRLWGWAPAALLLGVAPATAAAHVPTLVGGAPFDVGVVPQVVADGGGVLAFVAMTLATGPLSEEFGWRGYVQPRLRARMSPQRTVLVLGTVWALWHLPLFFLTGTFQSAMGLATAQGVLFLACMIPLSSAYWFVSERLRGGVPAAVLLHAAGNAGLGFVALSSPVAGAAYVSATLLVAVVVHLAAGRARTLPDPLRPSAERVLAG